MPITEKSKNQSSRVGITISVLLIVMLIENLKLEAHHTTLPVPITYSTEAASMHTVERETITCMECARLPMARIDVTGMAR